MVWVWGYVTDGAVVCCGKGCAGMVWWLVGRCVRLVGLAGDYVRRPGCAVGGVVVGPNDVSAEKAMCLWGWARRRCSKVVWLSNGSCGCPAVGCV